MLIYDFVQIDMPVSAIAPRIESSQDWLAPLAVRACQDGEGLLLRAGLGDGFRRLTKQVCMTVGPAHSRGDALVVPIHWVATGLAALFPVLDADLEFAPLDPDTTQLALLGSYDPPFDGIGSRIDRWALHRVTQATVRTFLARMADTLTHTTDLTAAATGRGLTLVS